MELNWDMDGTIANLYGVEDWLNDLINENTRPYEIAKPLLNFAIFARYLNKLKAKGYKINIISWTSKGGSDEYNERVAEAKIEWLSIHLPSVKFDKISIVPYGTPKSTCGNGILFDDEEHNRNEWVANGGTAYDVDNIISELKDLLK